MLQEVPWGRLVGRDAELGRMLTLLDDAASGQAVVALIGGDAGVGKTRLVAEVTRMATEQGFTVLSGHCAELGESVPYLPLADALRGVTRPPGSAAAAAAGQPPGPPRPRSCWCSRTCIGRTRPPATCSRSSAGYCAPSEWRSSALTAPMTCTGAIPSARSWRNCSACRP